jgi:hypothetical protein
VRSRAFALWLGLACATGDLAIAPTVAAAPADAARKTSYADVAIDSTKLGSASAAIERKLRERADVILRRDGVLPPRDASDPIISIAIEEVTGENPGYAYRVDIVRDGKAATDTKPTVCGLCTEGELVAAVGSAIEHAIGKLDDPPPVDVPPPRVDARATPAPAAAGRPSDTAKPTPALRIAGGTLLGTGVTATIIGAVLAAREPKPKADMPMEETNTRPPGYALIGVGAAVVVTGAVLLVVDARRRARAKRSAIARAR